jgi:hypothetical protein
VKEVFGHPEAPTPVNNRLRPEELPAAGMRGGTPNKASPYALHYQVRVQNSDGGWWYVYWVA